MKNDFTGIVETTEDAHRTPPRAPSGLDGETVEPRETAAAQGAPASRAEVFAEAVGVELPKPTRPASKPPKPAKRIEPIDGALWTRAQVAEYLGKSTRWVSAEVAAGAIPFTRIGRTPRFDPDRIRAWVAAGCPSDYGK